MIRSRLPKVASGTRLTTNLVNGIINRTEYAADLLRQYKLVAGAEMYVEPHYDGTRISYFYPVGGGATPSNSPVVTSGAGNMYIGIAGSTGGEISILQFSSFIVNGATASLDNPLGTATNLGGGNYRLVNNEFSQVGAVWKTSPIRASSFSAFFAYSIGGGSIFGGADGITLIFSSTKFLTGTGGGNGYQGGPSTSVAIEIDIFQNSFDPNNSHIAILSAGNISTHLAINSPTVRPSGFLACKYSQGILNVLHNGTTIISHPINIPGIIGSN